METITLEPREVTGTRDLYMSTTKIYHFEPARDFTCNSTEGICWLSQKLLYLRDTHCQSTFVCSSLKSNICGDYGFRSNNIYPDMDRLCYSGQKMEGEIVRNDSLGHGTGGILLEMWYLGEVKQTDFDCYFWCEAVAESDEDQTQIDSDILLTLVTTVPLWLITAISACKFYR